MKSMLAILAFTVCMFATGCGNNNEAKENKNTPDSIGNPTSNPSSTSVLTNDSTTLKDVDSLKH